MNGLGACEQADVIRRTAVLARSGRGRAAGPAGPGNDPGATGDIVVWVRAGGPGLADPPDILGLYEFGPSRRVRRGVEN